MPTYEVEVRRVVTEFYEVEAKDEDEARRKWYLGIEAGSIEDEAAVESVTLAFEDDGTDYDIDFEEGVDYDG